MGICFSSVSDTVSNKKAAALARMSEPVADIALIGLAVMGQNIILNMNDHGYVVCAYNRTTDKVDKFLDNEAKGTKIVGAHSLEEMVAKLKKPRRVMLLVKAGQAVDDFIAKLVPLLDKGDIIIDGGNSEYQVCCAYPNILPFHKLHNELFICRLMVNSSLGYIQTMQGTRIQRDSVRGLWCERRRRRRQVRPIPHARGKPSSLASLKGHLPGHLGQG